MQQSMQEYLVPVLHLANQTIHLCADYLSFLGVLIGWRIIFLTQKLQNRTLLVARGPQLQKELRKCCSNLSESLGGINEFSLSEHVVKFKATLRAIKRIFPNPSKKMAQKIINLMEKMVKNRSQTDTASVRNLYNELTDLEAEIEQHIKDQKWTLQN